MSDANRPYVPPVCGNTDHPRPVKAFVRLSWPEGPFKPAYACKGCLNWQIRYTLDDYERPVLVSPVPSAKPGSVTS